MEMFIAQQPKAIESRNWCQMIALTIFYNLVIRYINKLTFCCSNIQENLRYKRKITVKRRGYTNEIANISVTNRSREL